MMGRALLVWSGILVVAILNGALRQKILIPRCGENRGHVISTVLLSGAILLVAWVALPWLHPGSTSDAWQIGVLWLALTIAFEFLAGHYLFRQPWSKLVADYNLAHGRIWILVLIATLLAPALAFRGR